MTQEYHFANLETFASLFMRILRCNHMIQIPKRYRRHVDNLQQIEKNVNTDGEIHYGSTVFWQDKTESYSLNDLNFLFRQPIKDVYSLVNHTPPKTLKTERALDRPTLKASSQNQVASG